jgi:hypothetical protein
MCFLGIVPVERTIIINYHLWTTADRDAHLLTFAARKRGSFKHASEASFFELAPAVMCGLGVPGWQPDEYAYGRILRFFFVALAQGPSSLDAVMYAEVSMFSPGAVDEASGLPTINIDRVIPSPRVIPAKLLTTPVIAAPLTTIDQDAFMACERKHREFLATVEGTRLSSSAKLKVRRAHRELAQCAEALQLLGGSIRTRLILGGTIKLAEIH